MKYVCMYTIIIITIDCIEDTVYLAVLFDCISYKKKNSVFP